MAEVGDADAALRIEDRSPGHLVLHLAGDLDLASVEALEPAMTTLLESDARAVIVDAGSLGFLDTSGIALLLRLANRFPDFEVRGASPIVARCIGALGLTQRFGMTSDQDEAHRSFYGSPEAIRDARRFVAERLADLPRELSDSALVLTSELCTNAVVHVGEPFTVSVRRIDGVVRIAVSDPGDGQPQLLHPGEEAPHGRGLQLVAAMADRWGVDREVGTVGKRVWLELDVAEVASVDAT